MTGTFTSKRSPLVSRLQDLMDRLGVTFNRTAEGYRDQRCQYGDPLVADQPHLSDAIGRKLIHDRSEKRFERRGREVRVSHEQASAGLAVHPSFSAR